MLVREHIVFDYQDMIRSNLILANYFFKDIYASKNKLQKVNSILIGLS